MNYRPDSLQWWHLATLLAARHCSVAEAKSSCVLTVGTAERIIWQWATAAPVVGASADFLGYNAVVWITKSWILTYDCAQFADGRLLNAASLRDMRTVTAGGRRALVNGYTARLLWRGGEGARDDRLHVQYCVAPQLTSPVNKEQSVRSQRGCTCWRKSHYYSNGSDGVSFVLRNCSLQHVGGSGRQPLCVINLDRRLHITTPSITLKISAIRDTYSAHVLKFCRFTMHLKKS
jgi:hypothetical protein